MLMRRQQKTEAPILNMKVDSSGTDRRRLARDQTKAPSREHVVNVAGFGPSRQAAWLDRTAGLAETSLSDLDSIQLEQLDFEVPMTVDLVATIPMTERCAAGYL